MNVTGIHSFGIEYLTIERFVNDILHCVDLGVSQKWVGKGLLLLLQKDVFNTNERLQEDCESKGIVPSVAQ